MKSSEKQQAQPPQNKYFRVVFIYCIIAICGMVTLPFLGETGMANEKTASLWGKWLGFFGELHPLLLHLPIGATLVALTMEASALVTRGKYEAHTTLTLFFASSAAILASIFGYCLYLTGEFSGELIEEHKRDGIIFTILLILTFLFKYTIKVKESTKLLKIGYFTGLTLTTLTMISAGHHGGEITHGDPLDKAPWKKSRTKKITQQAKEDPIVYTSIIAPILAEKCDSCHGEKKQKGGLRTDSYAALIKGGDYEKCLVPGDIKESTMISFLHLPLDDDLRMPPEGKPQLSQEEIEILEWWVKENAPESKKLSELKASQKILQTINKL